MSSRYPTLNFGLGEDIDMLRDAVYQMCQKEIVPRAADIDRSNEFPMDLWRTLGDMGLLGITVEDSYGGSNMGYLAHSVVMEEISRASASVGLSYGAMSNLCLNQLAKNGNEKQKQKSQKLPEEPHCWQRLTWLEMLSCHGLRSLGSVIGGTSSGPP